MRYDLFFTTERVIAAVIHHPLDNPKPTSVWQPMFVGGFWSAGREGLRRERAAKEKRRSFRAMTPDELLSTNPRNLEIRYSQIDSAEIKHRFLQRKLVFHLSTPANKGRTVDFNLSKKQVPEAKRLLKEASLSEVS
jgi:hypothetical protein